MNSTTMIEKKKMRQFLKDKSNLVISLMNDCYEMNKSVLKMKFNARWLYLYTMYFLVHILIGSFSFISTAQDTKVYDEKYNLKYRVEGDRVYDKDWNLQYRIKEDKIYDKDWNLKYRIEEDKIYLRRSPG